MAHPHAECRKREHEKREQEHADIASVHPEHHGGGGDERTRTGALAPRVAQGKERSPAGLRLPGEAGCGSNLRGIPRRLRVRHHSNRVRQHHSAAMRLDPNTHVFVLTTAFMTSLAFAIFAMNVLALILYYTVS
jgi:hypothetical protein